MIANGDNFVDDRWWLEKDIFSPTSSPLRPLTFDLVADGCPITSTCPIFKLPIELLSKIICHLSRADLASLALIDRDCLQLARSVQFCVVTLSLSQKSVRLVAQFVEEISGGGVRRKRRIGPCVRRLVFGSCTSAHTLRASLETDTGEIRKKLALSEAYQTLVSSIWSCLPLAFPNLELFQYAEEQMWTGSKLLHKLSRIPLRHLSYDNFVVAPMTLDGSSQDLQESLLNPSAWSGMENLHVTLPSHFSSYDPPVVDATQQVLLGILRVVSPFVEGLRFGKIHYLKPEFTSSLPAFPRLRRLHLEEDVLQDDDEFLCKLLPPGGPAINSLEALQLLRIDSDHVIRLGHMPHLTRLVVNDISLRYRVPNLAFLAANPQLELLAFTFPIQSGTIRDRLLPFICTSGFSSLRILRLTFASTHVSRRAIAAIGLISSLEMLWLSAGAQLGTTYDWVIDHVALKRGLKPLRHLRELAFTRDDYHSEQFWNGHTAENEARFVDGRLRTRLGKEYEQLFSSQYVYLCVWEKLHCERMTRLAAEYGALFPCLEFIFVGQYPMEIVHDGQRQKINLLSDSRVSYLAELNDKWGSRTV